MICRKHSAHVDHDDPSLSLMLLLAALKDIRCSLSCTAQQEGQRYDS